MRRHWPAAAQPAARRPSPRSVAPAPPSVAGLSAGAARAFSTWEAGNKHEIEHQVAGRGTTGEKKKRLKKNYKSGSRQVWAAIRTETCRARSVSPDRGFPRRGTGSIRTPAPAAEEIFPAAAGGDARLNEGKQPQACGQRGIHQGEGITSCGGPGGSGALQGARRQGGPEDYFGAHVSDTPRIGQQQVQRPWPPEPRDVICDMPGNPSSSLNCPVTAASPSCCTSSLSLAWVHAPLPGSLLAFAEDCVFIFNTESFTSAALRVSFAGWDSAVGGNGWGSYTKCACMC
ncbi:uncharacterized protein LOC131577687 [Poecile atricapillus]|uniref:uncharacterized protein LOC131577687 n=1 Tax=Poecile atricapillus TaxID=48891 RepID=UPI002739A472|nr:uncharacterized protein LOC131577687 [Poecile atricapillus]